MEIFEKQILIFVVSILLGIALVFSGLPDKLHTFSMSAIKPFFERFNKEKATNLAESFGYTLELALVSLILITPLCGISSIWVLKIAYNLLWGKHAGVNVFVFHPFLNVVIAILCALLFGYALFSQYQWTIKLTQPRPKTTKDKDLARLI